MISVKMLKGMLSSLPEDAGLHACEGEDTGLAVRLPDGTSTWIRARGGEASDDQSEFNAWLGEGMTAVKPLNSSSSTGHRKVVINDDWGGFRLSAAAIRRWAELSGVELQEEGIEFGEVSFNAAPGPNTSQEARRVMSARGHAFDPSRDVARDDPALVRVVEALGAAANGALSTLKVVEIPVDADWYVDDLEGGIEIVRERHRTWR